MVQFVAVTYNGRDFSFDLFDLRAVDIANSDDMLRCLDALRWARADLDTHVPDGDVRVLAGIDRWACVGRALTEGPQRHIGHPLRSRACPCPVTWPPRARHHAALGDEVKQFGKYLKTLRG